MDKFNVDELALKTAQAIGEIDPDKCAGGVPQALSMAQVMVADAMRQAATEAARGGVGPVAWIRFTSTGGFEGPLHDCQIEEIRKTSGAWTPLYTQPYAPVVPEGYVLWPEQLTNEMVRAFSLSTVGRWDDVPEDQRVETAEKLQSAFEAMLNAAPDTNTIPCPACKGKRGGDCHVNTGLDSSKHRWEWRACDLCHGSGTVDESTYSRYQDGRNLRADRIARGETIHEASIRTGLTSAQISKQERGIAGPQSAPESDDPFMLSKCTHPDCGRFYDDNAKRWACRAWSDNACAAPEPPAPAVPEALTVSQCSTSQYCQGWNECREAMLKAAPKPDSIPDGWRIEVDTESGIAWLHDADSGEVASYRDRSYVGGESRSYLGFLFLKDLLAGKQSAGEPRDLQYMAAQWDKLSNIAKGKGYKSAFHMADMASDRGDQ